MRQSVAKDVAREIFYNEYLLSALSQGQLRSAAVLVLLGDEPREIPYLDALYIPRNRMYSVENVRQIFNRQTMWSLGVNLWYGDMKAFLRQALQDEQRIAVFNLDIEGSYRYNLDPSLTEIITYCLRFPETAVGTYTTIGHDEYMLFEGMYSLAVLLWLAPQETEECVATLERRYTEAGYENAFSLVLRDLFWIRSHMEHIVVATHDHGLKLHEAVGRLFALEAGIWALIQSAKKTPLRFDTLKGLVGQLSTYTDPQERAHAARLPHSGVRIGDFKHLIYRGDNAWSQKCYFAKFENISTNPIALRAWVVETLRHFTETPLTFINQKGCRTDYNHRESAMHSRSIIWRGKTLYTKFKPREIFKRFIAP